MQHRTEQVALRQRNILDDDDEDSYEELSHSIQILIEPNDKTSDRLDELLAGAVETD